MVPEVSMRLWQYPAPGTCLETDQSSPREPQRPSTVVFLEDPF